MQINTISTLVSVVVVVVVVAVFFFKIIFKSREVSTKNEEKLHLHTNFQRTWKARQERV